MGSNRHAHDILPAGLAVKIGITLLILTAVTVGIAQVDLGRFNFFIAMAVASVKAFFVVFYFMNLRNESHENAVMFMTSFLFLAIFIIFTSMDLFFRGDVYVHGPITMSSSAPSKHKKPWISTPEMIAHGKEVFHQQCISCHGENGKGDGPAAAALNPRPRNFSAGSGWKNGRRVTMIFKTLKEGLPPSAMASYATINVDDRWSLAHYVLTLDPEKPEADTPEDFAKAGLDPTKDGGGGEVQAPSIPVEVAMDLMRVPESKEPAYLFHPSLERPSEVSSRGAGGGLYERHCVRCHGLQGEGGIKVHTLGTLQSAYVVTAAFKQESEVLRSSSEFSELIREGLPGNLMPGLGQLSESEVSDLYQYVKGLKGW